MANDNNKPTLVYPGIYKTGNGFIVRVCRKDLLTNKIIERTQRINNCVDIQEAFRVKEDLAKKLAGEIEAGKETTKDISQLSYVKFVEFYQKFRTNNGTARENVISMDEEVYKRFVVPHIANVKISSFNKRIVFHYIDCLRQMSNANGVPYAVHTYKRAWQCFRQSIRFAYKQGYIDSDPTHLVAPKFLLAKPPREKIALNRAQAALLLDAACREGSYEYALVSIGVVLALRVCELKSLTYGDIDFNSGTISVSKSFHNGVHNRSVKNGRAFKTPMIGVVHSAVKKYYDATSAGKKPEDLLFPSKRSRTFFETSWFNSLLRRFCIEAGIPVISSHGLRRTACSILVLEGNVAQSVVSKILNHKTISVSEEYYTIVNTNEMARILRDTWEKDSGR